MWLYPWKAYPNRPPLHVFLSSHHRERWRLWGISKETPDAANICMISSLEAEKISFSIFEFRHLKWIWNFKGSQAHLSASFLSPLARVQCRTLVAIRRASLLPLPTPEPCHRVLSGFKAAPSAPLSLSQAPKLCCTPSLSAPSIFLPQRAAILRRRSDLVTTYQAAALVRPFSPPP
jgi:hypothetical protein